MKNGLFWTEQFYYGLCYQDTVALKTGFSKQISRQSVKGNASILFYRVIPVTLKQLYGPLIFVQVKDCLHIFWRHIVDIQHFVKRGTSFFFLLKSFSSFNHQECGKLRSTKTPRNSLMKHLGFLSPQRSHSTANTLQSPISSHSPKLVISLGWTLISVSLMSISFQS